MKITLKHPHRMKSNILIFALFTILSSCVYIDYLGNKYSPTPHVRLYFDEADIAEDYEVMGILTAEGPEMV